MVLATALSEKVALHPESNRAVTGTPPRSHWRGSYVSIEVCSLP